MKNAIAWLLILVNAAYAQTSLRTVMADSNGVVQLPTNFIATNRLVSVQTNGLVAEPANFWAANSNAINSVVPSITVNDPVFKRTTSVFANLLTHNVNGFISVSNSMISTSVDGTHSSGKAAVRLIDSVNSRSSAGQGTIFGNDSHIAWTRIEANPNHGTIRVVLGNNMFVSTNIAEYPTNRAIGFELSRGSGGVNQVRLIANNGATNTNGPWVAIGDVFQRYWIGVEQNRTNGEVKLRVGVNDLTATNMSSATIMGGPTNNSSGSAFEAGIFTANTNAAGSFLSIYSAFVDVID